MLKLLKWNFIDYIRKYYLILLGIFAANIVFSLFFIGSFSIDFSFEYGIPVYRFYTGERLWVQLCIITISLLSISSWIERRTAPLEASVSMPPWKILLSKILIADITSTAVISLSGLAVYGINLIANPSVQPYYWISRPADDFSVILLYSTTAILAFIFAKSFKLTRKYPLPATGIIYIVVTRIYGMIYWTHVRSFPIFPETGIIILFVAALFILGIMLYKYRFQIR